MPHLDCAIAITGTTFIGERIERLLKEFPSYEDLIAELAPLLELAKHDGVFDERPDGVPPDVDYDIDFRVLVAGWSNVRRRGEVHCVSSTAEPGREPFEMAANDIVMSPGLTTGVLADAGLMNPDGTLECTDPVDVLAKIIDLQRQTKHAFSGDPNNMRYTVGGAAVLTRIDGSGITQAVVRRWSDEIGSKIDPMVQPAPEAIGSRPAPTTNIVHLNRQQRRAAARAQRNAS